MQVKNLLPIGRFSKVTRLTIKALRHYDELGLLRPAQVDPDSGYRYYSLAQAVEAERIRVLRSLDVPLEQIQEILREGDPDAVRKHLGRHRQRIEQQVTGYKRALEFLQRLIDQEEPFMLYEVRTKEVSTQSVVSIRTHTSLARIGETMQQSYGELFGYLGQAGAFPAGPPLSIYHDPEFREEDIDVEMCVPVGQKVPGNERIVGRELPAGPAAYTLHTGPYDEIGPAYQALAGWIQEHGHEIAGPPREVYLVGPDRAGDPAEYRTEILWPIG